MIRNIAGAGKKIYLTFDDGPDQKFTDVVLDVLSRHQALATFFVVAERARAQKALLKRITENGHAVGNHSLDHTYSVFFAGRERLGAWVDEAEDTLCGLLGQKPVGFRPPNGICTPKLKSVLAERKMPLVLWNVRFYDTVLKWTSPRAEKSLRHTRPGDIVLLHDSLRERLRASFAKTLDFYLDAAKSNGYEFARLTRELTEIGRDRALRQLGRSEGASL